MTAFLQDINLIAAQVLGGVASRIGLLQELNGVLALGCDGNQSDADADPKSPALPDKPEIFNRVHQVFGDFDGTLQRAVLQQEAEFVAANPG